jgi:hypothetical protein
MASACQKLEKDRPRAVEASEPPCSTIDSKQLALVAQAVSPADFDFFPASHATGGACPPLSGLRLGKNPRRRSRVGTPSGPLKIFPHLLDAVVNRNPAARQKALKIKLVQSCENCRLAWCQMFPLEKRQREFRLNSRPRSSSSPGEGHLTE